jgi:hypothetical protein
MKAFRTYRAIQAFAGVAIFLILAPLGRAADTPPAVQVRTIADGLDNPLAVAVSPAGGDLLVSESGAGRVLRIEPTPNANPRPAITGFPVGQSASLAGLQVGPLGLVFTSSDYLVVGGGGVGPGKDAVRLFLLPAGKAAARKPLTIDDAKKTLIVKPGLESKSGVGDFYGLVAPPYAIFAASPGDADQAWITRGWIRGATSASFDTVLDLRPYVNSEAIAHATHPMALTISKRSELVVGTAGKFDASRDASLAFYDPANGRMLLKLQTGLFDVVGLGYSPQTGLLYAVDLAWAEPKEGGLFRLDAADQDGQLAVKATKIASLDRPTSLCFAPDGTLYVTTLGNSKAAVANAKQNKKTGQLLRITGNL